MENKDTLYNQQSRYYDVDTEYNLPQSNMLKTNYLYYTTNVLSYEAGRLDRVSYRVYNTPVHWWVIARFNSIINPSTVESGSVLKIPIL